MGDILSENLKASSNTGPHKHDELKPVSSGVALMAQAANLDSLLEPLAKTLMQLYKPAAIEILLRAPESSQLVPSLVLRNDGTKDQLFPALSGLPQRGERESCASPISSGRAHTAPPETVRLYNRVARVSQGYPESACTGSRDDCRSIPWNRRVRHRQTRPATLSPAERPAE